MVVHTMRQKVGPKFQLPPSSSAGICDAPCDSLENADVREVKSKKSIVAYDERDVSQRYRKGSLEEKTTGLTRLWT